MADIIETALAQLHHREFFLFRRRQPRHRGFTDFADPERPDGPRPGILELVAFPRGPISDISVRRPEGNHAG